MAFLNIKIDAGRIFRLPFKAQNDDGTPSESIPWPAKALLIASFIGSFMAWVADLVFRQNEAITTAIKVEMKRIFQFTPAQTDGLFEMGFEFLAFGVVLAMGYGLCYVFQPRSRPGAFWRGASPFAALIAIYELTMVSGAAAEEIQLLPNSDIEFSTAKPGVSGPLGLVTLATGKSDAKLVTAPLNEELTCSDSLTVGSQSFCTIDGTAAGAAGLDVGKSSKIWVLTK